MKANYNNHLPHAFGRRTRHLTIGKLKAERLRVKNARRAAHGLPAIKTYSAI